MGVEELPEMLASSMRAEAQLSTVSPDPGLLAVLCLLSGGKGSGASTPLEPAIDGRRLQYCTYPCQARNSFQRCFPPPVSQAITALYVGPYGGIKITDRAMVEKTVRGGGLTDRTIQQLASQFTLGQAETMCLLESGLQVMGLKPAYQYIHTTGQSGARNIDICLLYTSPSPRDS